MQDARKTSLFETMPIPRAVLALSVPTVLSSLVMVLYNLADTYFVGMLQDPIQNSAVTLAAPVLLAFNAVNNLFGVAPPLASTAPCSAARCFPSWPRRCASPCWSSWGPRPTPSRPPWSICAGR